MINTGLAINRQMVPRWRSLASTIGSQELSVHLKPTIGEAKWDTSVELGKVLTRWRSAPSIISAGELVEAAIVVNREAEAVDAARYLISNRSTATPLIQHQAQLLLARQGEMVLGSTDKSSSAVWRRRTRLHPDDALAWAELALEQTVAGKLGAASRAMAVARQLAPHNRHILRSASRLSLHTGDKQRAYDLIARNAATPSDPWLVAAEIALAGVLERSPRFVRQARHFLTEGTYRPRHISELAGALATTELKAGLVKRAKRMFGQSLIDPTGSTLAQAEWASPRIGTELVAPNRLAATTDGFEARAFHLHREGRLKEVLIECTGWAEQERSSIRPFEFAAMTAGQLGEFEEANRLAETGLELRATAPTLLNARAFALASLGRVDEAEKYLRKVVAPADDPNDRSMLIAKANEGLIAFRRGYYDMGRALYFEAIEGFRKKNHHLGATIAALYLARESILARTPDADTIFEIAKEAAGKFSDPHIGLLMEHIEKVKRTLHVAEG